MNPGGVGRSALHPDTVRQVLARLGVAEDVIFIIAKTAEGPSTTRSSLGFLAARWS
jgi:hypothetical protein